jgi:hypothetical protein
MADNAHRQPGGPRQQRGLRGQPQISPLLTVSAAGVTAVGIATGFLRYLDRSPIRESSAPGASAWGQQLARGGCLRCTASPGGGRPPVRPRQRAAAAARPLGRNAAVRLTAAARQASWRIAAAIPLLAVFGYCCWRVGEQVTAGLDPNFTANAWGGPTYPGAMACHYLDIALIIAASGWLLDEIRPEAARPR